jgi:hypothetical protein
MASFSPLFYLLSLFIAACLQDCPNRPPKFDTPICFFLGLMVYEQARVDHGGWTQARQKLANFQLRSEVEFFV